jgi:hypothetical protein
MCNRLIYANIIWCFQAVSHRSTNHVRRRLTTTIEPQAIYSRWHGVQSYRNDRSGTLPSLKRAHIKVWPHRKRTAAANCDLCTRREGFRTVLHKIASSPSNRRRADAADQSSSRRTAESFVLFTDLPGGQLGMAEEFTEKSA